MGGTILRWVVLSALLLGQELGTVDGQLTKDSCSLVQYGTAISACWVPYAMELVSSLTSESARRSPGGSRDALKTSFIQSCGDPLDNAFMCHAGVDELCGFRTIDTTRAKAVVKYMCQNFDVVFPSYPSMKTIRHCYDGKFFDCVEKYNYADTCGMTAYVRECLKVSFSNCTGYQTFFDTVFRAGMLEKCTNISPAQNKPGHCAAVGSAGAMALCAMPFGIRMTERDENTRRIDVKKNFDTMCSEKSNNVLLSTLRCFDDVQTECGVSYVNIAELTTVKDKACAIINTNVFEQIERCTQRTTLKSAFPCFNNVQLSQGDNVLCKMTEDFRRCSLDIFNQCSSALVVYVDKIYNLGFLPCPHAQTNPSCSIAEHLSSHSMCWYTSLTTLVPWNMIYEGMRVRYDAKLELQTLCGKDRHLVEASIACHEAADERCDWMTMKASFIRKLLDEFCGDLDALLEVQGCVKPDAIHELGTCSVAAKNIDPSEDGAYCRVLSHMKQCVRKMLAACSAKVRTKFDDVYDILVDNVCPVVLPKPPPSGADKRYPMYPVMVSSLLVVMFHVF